MIRCPSPTPVYENDIRDNKIAEEARSEVVSDTSSPRASEDSLEEPSKNHRLGKVPRGLYLVPFFAAGALYLSVVFAFFSAIPMVVAYVQGKRAYGIVAMLTNFALVWILAGALNAGIFLIIGVVLAVGIGEGLLQRQRIERMALATLLYMSLACVSLGLGYGKAAGVNILKEGRALIGITVDRLAEDIEKHKSSGKPITQELDEFVTDPQLAKDNIIREFPSAALLLFFVLIVINILVLVRLHLSRFSELIGVTRKKLNDWKAPEYLVWPTIACGFCLIIEVPYVTPVALNLFRLFMAIYALQGLAIISYLLDSWRLKGFLRFFAYLLALVVLLPLTISLGFFDLWFEFRQKFTRRIS